MAKTGIIVSFGLVLYFYWILLSGFFTPLLMGLGALSCLVALFFAYRMGTLDHEGHPLYLHRYILRYVPWLLWEIIKANVAVARIILKREMPIAPRIIQVESGQKTELSRVIYANSITLTPGTVTVNIWRDTMVVHAIDKQAADGVQSGEMARRLARYEKEPQPQRNPT